MGCTATAVAVAVPSLRRGSSSALTKQTHGTTTIKGRRRGALTLASAEDDGDDAGATDDADDYNSPDYNEFMEDFAFGAVARIYGDSGLQALRSARVAVVGLGGVGSYAVEVGRGRYGRCYMTESKTQRRKSSLKLEAGVWWFHPLFKLWVPPPR